MSSPADTFTRKMLAQQEKIDDLLKGRQSILNDAGYVTCEAARLGGVWKEHHDPLKSFFEDYKHARKEVEEKPGDYDAGHALVFNKTIYLRIHKETPDILKSLQELSSRALTTLDQCTQLVEVMNRFHKTSAAETGCDANEVADVVQSDVESDESSS